MEELRRGERGGKRVKESLKMDMSNVVLDFRKCVYFDIGVI